jgi:hypothetical protein
MGLMTNSAFKLQRLPAKKQRETRRLAAAMFITGLLRPLAVRKRHDVVLTW